jgi:hypothetical protein
MEWDVGTRIARRRRSRPMSKGPLEDEGLKRD